jgi:GT2 family glycosyltransferase
MLQLYIIILNYEKWVDTQECIASLLHSNYNNFSVIVIDNDSKNDSLKHLSDWLLNKDLSGFSFLRQDEINNSTITANSSQFIFIQNKMNAGFAGGINPVLQVLQNEDAFVWLLNPDMIVEKNALGELIEFATSQPAESIIGAEIRAYKGNHRLLFYGGGMINFHSGTIRLCKKINEIPKLDFISGGSLFTHASNFKKLGLLPEKYFLYWEDTDWTYTAKQKGYSLKVCKSSICFDKVSSVIGKSFLGDYYYSKNGLLFVENYKKKNISKALFFMSFRFLKRVVSGKWKRAHGIWRGTMDYLKLQHNESK